MVVIELLHYLKILIEARNDNENTKYAHWTVNYLLGNYLFDRNIGIMLSIEQLFVSMLVLCESAFAPTVVQRTEKEIVYVKKLQALFQSLLNFYSVLFRSVTTNMTSYLSTHKRVTAESKKNFLKSLKIQNFFEKSGQKNILSQGNKKRRDDINLKFFKILIRRCPELKQFIRLFNSEDLKNIDVPEFAFICILSQMMIEVELKEEKKKRALQNGGVMSDSEEESEAVEQVKRAQSEHRQDSIGILPAELGPSMERGRVFNLQPQSEEIIFENEETDEKTTKPRGEERPVDERTKNYLNIVRQYQYDDEYDDTHETDNKFRKRNYEKMDQQYRQDTQKPDRAKRGPLKKHKDEDDYYPSEDGSEDDLEDLDLLNKYDRTQSNHYGQEAQEIEEGNEDVRTEGSRGAGEHHRGGRGSRGRGGKVDHRGGFDRKKVQNVRYPKEGDSRYQSTQDSGYEGGQHNAGYNSYRGSDGRNQGRSNNHYEQDEYVSKKANNDGGYERRSNDEQRRGKSYKESYEPARKGRGGEVQYSQRDREDYEERDGHGGRGSRGGRAAGGRGRGNDYYKRDQR